MPYAGNYGFIGPSHSHLTTAFLNRVISLGLEEFIILDELLEKSKFQARNIDEDVIVLSELLDPVKILVRELAESVGISEVLDRATIKARSLTETISISDALTQAQIITKNLAESIGISDALTRLLSKARSLTESITIGETLTRTLVKLRPLTNPEAVTLSEVLTFARVRGKALAESVTVSEALARVTTKARFLYETDDKPSQYIPLFIYPNWYTNPSNYDWTPLFNIIQASPNLNFVVTINVASGPDTSLNTDYVQGLTDLFAAGQVNNNLTILGYVFTSYGVRNIATVETDIDRWVSFYGTWVDGIFLDEMDNITGHETYYTNITTYAKVTKGLTMVWGNPGTATIAGYVGTVDTIMVYEDSTFPSSATMNTRTFNGAFNRNNFAAIVHSQPDLNSKSITDSMSPYVGYLYITNDIMSNPYDTLASYLVREAQTLSRNGITIGETLTRALLKLRTPNLTQSISLSEALTTVKVKGKLLTESISIGETPAMVRSKFRSLTETITVTDLAQRIKFFAKSITETPITVAHSIPALVKLSVRSLSESVGVSDSATKVKKSVKTLAETIAISDAISFIQTISRSISETITVSDTLTRLKSRTLALAETISISDLLTKRRLITVVKNITETISIGDLVTFVKHTIIIPWTLTDQSTDFPDKLDNLLKTYITDNWSISTPAIGTDNAADLSINNFQYDKFRTYYIQIVERPATITNRQIRQKVYEFETPIEFICSVRRLKKGEAFSELNNIINELMHLFGTYQKEDIFGVQGVTFDSITPLSSDSANKTVWSRTLQIRLHYYKVDRT